SEQAWQASFNVAAGASPYATYACVDTWLTDFRADLPKIDVPMLVIHGTEDRILPFTSTAARLPELVPGLTVLPVANGPHNAGWTFPDEVNRALLDFLAGWPWRRDGCSGAGASAAQWATGWRTRSSTRATATARTVAPRRARRSSRTR